MKRSINNLIKRSLVFAWALFVMQGVAHPSPPQAGISAALQVPEWCKALPRPEYESLQRVLPGEPWFEVYKVTPGVFAIYEPHQAEEVISYLIVGPGNQGTTI